MTSGKGKTTKTVKKISGYKGWIEGERRIRRAGGIFRAVKILDPIIMDTCHYILIFVQTHRTHNTKNDP